MITISPLFAMRIKIVGLTAIAPILFSTNVALATTVEEAPDVESDSGLTATLNSATFGRGDTVTVTGTVEERDGSASMYATIIDPGGIEISTDSITVGSDLTFRYGFVAGEDDEMSTAGTYTVEITYFPPGDASTQSVTLDFEYNPEASSSPVAPQTTTTTTAASAHISPDDGFRVQVPEGWIIWDINNTLPIMQQREVQADIGILAELCPQEGTIPQIGGELTCSPSEEASRVVIHRYANLTSRPEFSTLVGQGQNITLSDFTAFWLQKNTEGQTTNQGYDVDENEARTVNIFDAATNTTLEGVTAPAQWIRINVGVESQGLRAITTTYSALLVLSLDGNTGYVVTPIGLYDDDGGLPEGSQEVIDSFELVAASSTPFSSSSTTSTNLNATASQTPQQQQPSPSPLPEQLVL